MSTNTDTLFPANTFIENNKNMWAGKVAFITGAGSPNDIGGTTAQAFAALGVQTALFDLKKEDVQSVSDAIIKAGGKKPLCLTGDVSKVEDCQNAIDEIEKQFGRLDFAFNNAGIPQAGKLANEITPAYFEKVGKINLFGIFYCLHAELNLMLKLGNSGAIVNTASVLGLNGAPKSTDYCASKFGIVGMTKGSAIDMAKKNIRINAICPGAVQTPLLEQVTPDQKTKDLLAQTIPVGHSVDVHEIAEAVIFLCSPRMKSLTGTTLTIDGGMSAQLG